MSLLLRIHFKIINGRRHLLQIPITYEKESDLKTKKLKEIRRKNLEKESFRYRT